MREIKFRGKRVDTGEWVYGYLIVTNKDNKSFIQDCDYSSVSSVLGGVTTYCLSSYHYSQVEVIPETVGQFTGLTDKNGKEIYEGDVVKTKYENCPKNEHIENVVFYNGSFRSTNKEETCYCLLYDGTSHLAFDKSIYMSEIEVIGTIHDKE